MTTIKLKNGSGAPTSGDLAQGEPALDLTNKRLYTEDSGGTVIEVGTNPTSITTGAITSTGIDVTGVVEATGYLAVEGTSGNTGAGTDRWIGGDGTAGTWFYNVPTGSNHYFAVNNTNKLAINSTGIDVTGTATMDGLTSSGAIKAETTFGGFLTLKRNDTTLTNNADIGSINFEQTDSDNAGVPVNILASGDGTAGGGKLRFYTGTPTSRAQRQTIYSNGDVEFYEDTGTTAKLVWKSADERLGIGTSSPATRLDFGNDFFNGTPSTLAELINKVALYSDGAGPAYGFGISSNALNVTAGSGGDIRFHTNGASERMRIDSSGNLLVGTTAGSGASAPDNSSTAGDAGVRISGDGYIGIGNNTNPALYLNIIGADGVIQQFRKDGSTVGSIGTDNGDLTIFSSASGHGGVRFATSGSLPINNSGALVDNDRDIGSSSYRWKDIYLSGGIRFGATGSDAKHLDDYEEGTFTPELRDATSGGNTATTTHKYGHYTKVGNLVTIWMHFRNINTTGMTSGNSLSITGLPFTADNNLYTAGPVSTDRVSFSGNYLTFSVTENTAYGPISIIDSNAQDASLLVSAIDGTGSDIQGICVQYRTA